MNPIPLTLSSIIPHQRMTTLCGLLCLLVLFAMVSPNVHAADDKPKNAQAALNQTLHDELIFITLQAGTAMGAFLLTPLDTDINQPNDPVECKLMTPVWLGERLVLPSNTRFYGLISRLEQPLQGRNAVLDIDFYEARLPNGERIPLQAELMTLNKELFYGGETTDYSEHRPVRFDIQGIGSIVKLQKGGLLTMGKAVTLLPGENLKLILKSPLKLVVPTEEIPMIHCCD